MELNSENKINFKTNFLNFYHSNKLKILSIIIIIFLVIISLIFLQHNKEKKNILIAEKYIKAGTNLTSNKSNEAKKIYEEIVISGNKFYSILALNNLIEKKLITDQNEILRYFSILEETVTQKDRQDLIILKKALYLKKINNSEEGNNLLKKLIDKNSSLKKIAQEIMAK